MFFSAFLLFLSASVSLSDPAVDAIMKQRDAELEKAAKNYDMQVLQADSKALKQLTALLRSGASSADRESLEKIKKAIARIEERADALPPSSVAAQKKKTQKSSALSEDYPEGTFAKFGRHFYVFPVKMNYDDAKNACSVMGGSVLRINNGEEYNYFVEYAFSEKKALWVDVLYSKSENRWQDGKGGKAAFIKWQEGYPVSPADAGNVLINCKSSKGAMINVPGSRAAETIICEWDR